MQQTRAVFPRHALQSFKASTTKRYSQNCLQKATGFINKIETRTVDIGYDFTSLFFHRTALPRADALQQSWREKAETFLERSTQEKSIP